MISLYWSHRWWSLKSFRKKIRKSLTENFCSIWFSSMNFWNFRLNDSLFGNSTISGFSGNFIRKFPYHLSPIRNFRNYWLNGKCPSSLARFCFVTCVTLNFLPSRPFHLEGQPRHIAYPVVPVRFRLLVFTYCFNFYFLSFPAGQLCLCRSGFLHSLQPLSRAALPTYSSPCGRV